MSLSNAKLEIIRRLIRRQVISSLQKVLENLKPADLSEIMLKLTPSEQKIIITTLHLSGKAGALLTELPEYKLKSVLEGIPNALLASTIEQIQADDSVMLLSHLDPDRKEKILSILPDKLVDKLEEIMKYEKHHAGAIMNTNFLELTENMTSSESLEKIKKWSSDTNDPIYSIYVLDETKKLVGVLSIRKLALAASEATLGNLMTKDPIVINAWDNFDEATKLIIKYDLVSLPVVDDNFRLLGIIMVDDMIDSVMESLADDAYHIQGITDHDRLETPVIQSIKSRFPWMLINLCTAFVASSIVGMFETTIASFVALATFMPIVAGLGGNTGSQALAVTIRALALGELEQELALKAIMKQVIVALLIAVLIGSITALIAILWRGNPVLGLIIFISMIINMTMAGLVGSGIPWLLKSFGQDPAMGGGVLVTAVTDSLGFLSFLGIATLFISHLN